MLTNPIKKKILHTKPLLEDVKLNKKKLKLNNTSILEKNVDDQEIDPSLQKNIKNIELSTINEPRKQNKYNKHSKGAESDLKNTQKNENLEKDSNVDDNADAAIVSGLEQGYVVKIVFL